MNFINAGMTLEETTNDDANVMHLSGGIDVFIQYEKRTTKTDLRLSATYKHSKILAFSIKTSKEFVERIADVLTNASKVFCGLNTDDARVTFRVKKGMLKMTAKICPGTKVVTSYPVDDETSFGKIVLTMKDLSEIKKELDEI